MAKEKLHVVISLDVEEEGLFSGRYAARNAGVSNVSLLPELAPISGEYGFPLTLLCAHSVFANPPALRTLEYMRDRLGAEIGAHLHHWSTPPFLDEINADTKPERTHKLPPDLLEARLDSLLEAGRDFLDAPLTSFRMGRWDLKAPILPLLARRGITVDSSICPLRSFAGGANHFLAPADPYWHKMPDGGKILEAPITQIPLMPKLATTWEKTWKNNTRILDSFHFFGALSANPLWHNEKIMCLAVKTHLKRGGRILNLFWHSSEMMPGCSPHVPNQASADRLLQKIFAFCSWLRRDFGAAGITMNQLPTLDCASDFPVIEADAQRDW